MCHFVVPNRAGIGFREASQQPVHLQHGLAQSGHALQMHGNEQEAPPPVFLFNNTHSIYVRLVHEGSLGRF
ncbi:hypothetical protein BEN49_17175 [Hymenobacter coccineus]|uniref:Uncharacterized protein n=1 Tax=Hymenobacter coccineus TaxID=1908235 RepID=A0A1G1TMK3_9BACT|nr:hypothetical protein BEN49_17175 [Hymenobacter coccineus]